MRITRELLDTLCAIAEEAGKAIMEVYDSADEKYAGEIIVKDDQSPLTIADLRADAIIRARLESAFPGVYILSEESRSVAQESVPGSAQGNAQDSGKDAPFFLVDPLDGTKEFIKRNGEFTVNIALIADGQSVAGVVYVPAMATLYYAGAALGAWRRRDGHEIALATSAWDKSRPLRVIGSRSHGGDGLSAWLKTLPCEYEFIPAGSSLKFCLIAEGAADIYPRFGPTSQWDTAAAQCVLCVAGGSVSTLDGAPLRYGLAEPILNKEFIASASASMLQALAAYAGGAR